VDAAVIGVQLLPPWVRIVLGALVFTAGLAFGGLGAKRLREAGELRTRGVAGIAAVTFVDSAASDSDTGVRVRYRFDVSGVPHVATGVFGTEVATDVTPEELETARRTGMLEVTYLPERPDANVLTSHLDDRAAKSRLAISVGAGLALAGMLGLALGWAAARKQRGGATRV